MWGYSCKKGGLCRWTGETMSIGRAERCHKEAVGTATPASALQLRTWAFSHIWKCYKSNPLQLTSFSKRLLSQNDILSKVNQTLALLADLLLNCSAACTIFALAARQYHASFSLPSKSSCSYKLSITSGLSFTSDNYFPFLFCIRLSSPACALFLKCGTGNTAKEPSQIHLSHSSQLI